MKFESIGQYKGERKKEGGKERESKTVRPSKKKTKNNTNYVQQKQTNK